MKTVQASDILESTQVSYRQLDYWVRTGVVLTLGKNTPGSGHPRQFDPSVIDRIEVMMRASRAFNHILSKAIMKKIYDNFDKKKVDLGEGISLVWK